MNFSSVYLNKYKELDIFLIGFEFEFFSNYNYAKTIELFNTELYPIKVHGSKTYHSKFKTSENNFKLEPDYSGGFNMIELVTHYFPYREAKILMLKILKIIQENGYTNEKSAFQFTISIDTEKLNKQLLSTNILKFILNFDENEVYKYFPERKDSMYAQSIYKILPYHNFFFHKGALNSIINSLQLPDTKYYGVNFSKPGLWEFRYMGGKDYEYKSSAILEIMDYFLINVNNSFDNVWTDTEIEKLKEIVNDNYLKYKDISNYDFFLNNFTNVKLLVDLTNDYDIINTYYESIWCKLHDLLNSLSNIKHLIINYDSDLNKFELKGGEFKIRLELNNMNLINCNIKYGLIKDCIVYDCNINRTHIESCKIINSYIENSKLIRVKTDISSYIKNSYLTWSKLNCNIENGVIRGCSIDLKTAELIGDVKQKSKNNYFNSKKLDRYEDKNNI